MGDRVLIHACPVSPGNVVRIFYSIDNGPERVARAWCADPSGKDGWQSFVADLPRLRRGSVLTWRPVLSNAGQEADPGRPMPPKLAELASEPVPEGRSGRFPYDLKFLARVTAPLAENPYSIGMTPDGLRMVFLIGKGGTVRGPLFNGTIDHVGGDWMRIRDDGIGVTNIRALIRTDDGSNIMSEYSGFVDFGPDGQTRMAAGKPPPDANLDLTPRYLTSDPQWNWLNRLQCVGFGRVTMSTLLVEYDLYGMKSRAADLPEGTPTDA